MRALAPTHQTAILGIIKKNAPPAAPAASETSPPTPASPPSRPAPPPVPVFLPTLVSPVSPVSSPTKPSKPIMTTGTLAIKVLKVEAIHDDAADSNKNIALKIKIGNEIKHSKHFNVGHDLDVILYFELDGETKPDDEIVIESHTEGKKKDRAASAMLWKVKLTQFLKHTAWTKTGLNSEHYKIHVESKFTAKPTAQKPASEGVVEQAKEAAASLVTLNPQRTLAVSETHRPWFLRVAYYYDTTKNVYNYTTSFRVIAPVARFGESTANTILQKVTGKTLADFDGQLVAPGLSTIDNTVDATISTVLVKLVQGQNYVLKKKDDAVTTASGVIGSTLTTAGKAKDYTTSTVSGVVGSTLSTVGKAKDYTTSSVKSVTTSTYNTVATVTDYTTTQVVNVSSSAFGKVRGATVYLASYVPYVGTKIRA